MKTPLILILFCFFVLNAASQTPYMQQWPSFRGPWGLGFIENSKPATTWNIETGEHIKWKTAIPGLGHSSPIVWDNFVFVTTAVNTTKQDSLKVGWYGDIDEANDSVIHEFKVYCLDKNSGKIIWERVAHKGIPKSKRHIKASQANCTPATNGKYVVVHFGSEGLYCYDFKGNLIWKKDMGILSPGFYTIPGTEWGYSSSPVIVKKRIVVLCDIPKTPYLTLLDLETGNEIWKASREDEVETYGTPAVFEKNGKLQIVVNGFRHAGGYDFETGKEIWRLADNGDIPTPTPVIVNDLIYLNSWHGKFSPILAVRTGAQGNITLARDSTHNKYIAWSVKRGGAYMHTPLVYDGYLYNLHTNGQLTCFDAKTGEMKYKNILKDTFSASGIAADGKLYFSSENGNIFVVQAGPEFKLLAQIPMNDLCMATPAISDNTLFFRTQHYLVAVE